MKAQQQADRQQQQGSCTTTATVLTSQTDTPRSQSTDRCPPCCRTSSHDGHDGSSSLHAAACDPAADRPARARHTCAPSLDSSTQLRPCTAPSIKQSPESVGDLSADPSAAAAAQPWRPSSALPQPPHGLYRVMPLQQPPHGQPQPGSNCPEMAQSSPMPSSSSVNITDHARQSRTGAAGDAGGCSSSSPQVDTVSLAPSSYSTGVSQKLHLYQQQPQQQETKQQLQPTRHAVHAQALGEVAGFTPLATGAALSPHRHVVPRFLLSTSTSRCPSCSDLASASNSGSIASVDGGGAGGSPARRALYARLGGADAVKEVLDRLYNKVVSDPQLGRFFVNTDMVRLRTKQARFLMYVFGGAQVHNGGKMMVQEVFMAHAHLLRDHGLNMSHFDHLIQVFDQVLQEVSLGQDLRAEAAASLMRFRPLFDPKICRGGVDLQALVKKYESHMNKPVVVASAGTRPHAMMGSAGNNGTAAAGESPHVCGCAVM